jgi:hypothetical protein
MLRDDISHKLNKKQLQDYYDSITLDYHYQRISNNTRILERIRDKIDIHQEGEHIYTDKLKENLTRSQRKYYNNKLMNAKSMLISLIQLNLDFYGDTIKHTKNICTTHENHIKRIKYPTFESPESQRKHKKYKKLYDKKMSNFFRSYEDPIN